MKRNIAAPNAWERALEQRRNASLPHRSEPVHTSRRGGAAAPPALDRPRDTFESAASDRRAAQQRLLGQPMAAQPRVAATGLAGGPPMRALAAATPAAQPLEPAPRPTGASILGAPYDGIQGNFTADQLAAAHQAMLDRGYVFVGFKGGTQANSMRAVNEGMSAYRSNVWSGLYVADDPAVAAGYTVDDVTGNAKGGQLVRVYLPAEDAARIQNVTTSLNRKAGAMAEFARSFGHPLGADEPYAIRGFEGEERTRKETILSRQMAERAVAIPSTVTVNQAYGGDVTRYPAAEQQLSTPPEGVAAPDLPTLPEAEVAQLLERGTRAAADAKAAYEAYQTGLKTGDVGGAVEALRRADALRFEAEQSLGSIEGQDPSVALPEGVEGLQTATDALAKSAKGAHEALLTQGEALLARTRTSVEAAQAERAAGQPDAAVNHSVAEHFGEARKTWSDAHQVLGYLKSASQTEPGLLSALEPRLNGLQSGVNTVNGEYTQLLEGMVSEAEQLLDTASSELEALAGQEPNEQNSERYGRATEIVARATDLQHELGRHGLSGPEGTREEFQALESRLGTALSRTESRASAVGVEFADGAMVGETAGANAATFENLWGKDYVLRGGLRWGGRVALVLAVAADGYKLYKADNKVDTGSQIAGGWLGGAVAGGLAAAGATAALTALGPPGWLAELGVFTAATVAGVFGYKLGAKAGHAVYDVFKGKDETNKDPYPFELPQSEEVRQLLAFDDDTNFNHKSGAWYAKHGIALPAITELHAPAYQPWPVEKPSKPPFAVGG